MSKLIFFVDDDKMMLHLMEYTFKCKDGFEVMSFYSGEDCIENVHHNPDIIVLDYHLGDDDEKVMSGLDTLKSINSKNLNIPVIILSRETDKGTINEFLEEGAIKYVIKDDFFIDTLTDTIDKHFSLS